MMAYQNSNFTGTKAYSICADSICVGDKVAFERAVFTGGHPNFKFVEFEQMKGTIISVIKRPKNQQYTFTIKLNPACAKTVGWNKLQIRGRDIRTNRVYRKTWKNESDRGVVLAGNA